MSVVHSGVPCKVCRKPIPPATARHCGNERRGYVCENCYVSHYVNTQALSQQLTQQCANDVPIECPLCHQDLDQIERATGSRSMYFHTIEGVAALLCKFCSDSYVYKSGQFKDTEYGKKLGVTGYK